MPTNRDFLIDNLQAGSLLDSRYNQIKCVNYDPLRRKKMQGYFSLVFKAWDTLTEHHVAIKFFDPDPAKMADTYRIQAFEREPQLLQMLLGKNRCLQLVASLKNHIITVGPSGGAQFNVQFPYFVVEWLDDHIDQYFQSQETYDAITKLTLFRDVVLAVEALHYYDIHHRDLKPDNFRSFLDKMKRIVVAIDLGTAARLDSGAILSDYTGPVGHLMYSAPETYCGLAGNRDLAPFTDYYALGCMLYELFSTNYFGMEIQQNGSFECACAAISILLVNAKDLRQKQQLYEKNIGRFKHAVQIPDLNNDSVSVPASIIQLLNQTLRCLVAFDYNDRFKSLENVRYLIDTSIRVLKNEKETKRRLDQSRLRRQNRERHLAIRDQRIKEYFDSMAEKRISSP